MTGDIESMMTIGEVSKMLHIHPNTLRRWAEEGRISTWRINSRGDRRFKKSDVENFLSKQNPFS